MYDYKDVSSTAGLTDLRVNSALNFLSHYFCLMMEKYVLRKSYVS